jgi:hypothetical protein
MRIQDVKLDGVYTFTKSGNEVRVLVINTDGSIEVERTTSGKKMIVTANALEEVSALEFM